MEQNQKKTSKDLPLAMKKYLIGHEYRLMVQNAEALYEKAAMEGNQEYMDTHRINCKQSIAAKLAERCFITKETVVSYGLFADAVDALETKNEDLATKILTGKARMTYRSIQQMAEVL